MPQPLVKTTVYDHHGTIILNRPGRCNALSRAMIAELQQALEDLHCERKVRVVILTAAGNTFCAGMDLSEMLETCKSDEAMEMWHEDAVAYRDLLVAMLRFPKPIIAAVNGPAIAGGAGLMLACDMAVGCDAARFGLPEPRRGLVAGLAAPLLVFRHGAAIASRLLLSGEIIDAQEALRIGLYQQLVKFEQVWARGVELAGESAACAPEALQLTKRMLNETIGEKWISMLSCGAAASATSRTTEAAREGIEAFLEKRDPLWP